MFHKTHSQLKLPVHKHNYVDIRARKGTWSCERKFEQQSGFQKWNKILNLWPTRVQQELKPARLLIRNTPPSAGHG